MSRALVRAYADESLYVAWLRMSRRNLRQLPVVGRAVPTRLVGVVTADAIARLLRLPAVSQGTTSIEGNTGKSAGPILAASSLGTTPRGTAADNNGTGAVASSPPVEVSAIAATVDTEEDHDENDEHPEATRTAARTSEAALERVLTEARQEAARRDNKVGESAELKASVAQVLRGKVQRAGASASASGNGDPFAVLKVRDAMLRTPRTICETEPLDKARRLLDERGDSLLVIDEQGNLSGIVTRTDLHSRKEQAQERSLTVGDVAVRNLVTARPDETLRVAVHRLNGLGLRQLPVIAGDESTRPLGLLRRGDVLAAYEQVMEETGSIGQMTR